MRAHLTLAWTAVRRAGTVTNRAAGGLWLDLALYVGSAVFAWFTIGSTLAPHRAWAAVAWLGYAAAAVLVIAQLVAHRAGVRALTGVVARALLTAGAWIATALVPLVIQAVQRAHGQLDRAQEEVVVIEDGGRRLIETGTPYLSRAAISALPEPERLLGYLPYQPGMAVFGLPRTISGITWWTDARVWFALVTLVALASALSRLHRAGASPTALVRAGQMATVLPICALTLATGGDDLPVLALSLLGLALAATGRLGGSGLAVGAAAALKLFAWPIAVVLGVHALTQKRLGRYAAGAVGLPVLTALPVLWRDRAALVENVLAFPFGRGVVSSPAASPLPGQVIATHVPGGRIVTVVLLALAAAAVATYLVRHPPVTAADAALAAGWALLAAMLLLPSTRFGYLLYPVALLAWAPALRAGHIPAPRAAPRLTAEATSR